METKETTQEDQGRPMSTPHAASQEARFSSWRVLNRLFLHYHQNIVLNRSQRLRPYLPAVVLGAVETDPA